MELLLLDTSSVLYRSFHALPELTSSSGFPTNALLGTMRCLESLHKRYPNAHIVAAMDAPGRSFRHDWYGQYKAHRAATPDALVQQIEAIKAIFDARGITRLAREGIEADDLIASIVRRHHDLCSHIYVVTMDKDLAQLVDERVVLIYGKNFQPMGINAVREKYGVQPEQMIDYLSLLGDDSDNIPGVRGIGPKSAARILAQNRNIEEFLAKADPQDKLAAKVLTGQKQWALARRLIQLKDDEPLPDDLLTPRPVATQELRALYKKYELKSLLEALDPEPALTTDASQPADQSPDASNPISQLGFRLTVVNTEQDLREMCARLTQARLICLNCETTGLDYRNDTLVGIALAIEPDQAWYVPLAHQRSDMHQELAQLNAERVLNELHPILGCLKTTIVGQNLRYDSNVLYFASSPERRVELAGDWHDTFLQSSLLKDRAKQQVDLDTLALRYLDHQNLSHTTLLKQQAKSMKKPVGQVNFSHLSIALAAQCAAEGAVVCLSLHKKIYPQIAQSSWRKQLYHEIDLPLSRLLARMEKFGIAIDQKKLTETGREFSKRIDQTRAEIIRIAGHPINPDSPKQLSVLLFDQLKLPVVRKTSHGQPSTDADVLEQLARNYPEVALPQLLLEYRRVHKLKSTYVDDLLAHLPSSGTRIHAHFQQGVTLTGRLACDHPNLQNVPIRHQDGLRIRAAFVAAPGFQFLSCDYSQIELRIVAHFSGDQTLIEAFRQGVDIHNFTASELFGIKDDLVDSHQRRIAKTINFGLIYGMTAHGLSARLDVPFYEAQTYMDAYFARYPSVADYMGQTKALAYEQGYVTTLLGRRIMIDNIKNRNVNLRQRAERVAINAPIQGSGADIINQAMLDLDRQQLAFSDDHRLLLQVHDELLFEIRNECVEQLRDKITEVMCRTVALEVPLEASAKVGKNWAELAG